MKPRVVVLGASGHAKVVLEILEEMGNFEIIGCTTAAAASHEILRYPVLGGDDILPALFASGTSHAFVAVGDNRIRQKVIRRIRDLGFTLVSAVSRSALVSPRARLGEGVAVMPRATINVDSLVDDGAIINTGATVDHDCIVGECAHIAPGVNLAGNVKVGQGAFLGIGSCAIPGVAIGAWAMVGAGAAVLGDLPDGVTAVGVPARVLRTNK